MTPVLVLTPLIPFVLCLAFIARVLIKLLSSHRKDEITPEWLQNCVARYEPMEALFDQEDFAFLSRQPGFDLNLYRKLRRERLRIFRQYLNRLIADYNRLHAMARGLLAKDQEEHSEMLVRLIKLKVNFSLTVIQAEANYLLCCFGYRTLMVRALILRLQELSLQVSAISASQAA